MNRDQRRSLSCVLGWRILPKGSSSSSNESRNDVSCEEISLTMDDVGPRVTFGANVVLLPG